MSHGQAPCVTTKLSFLRQRLLERKNGFHNLDFSEKAEYFSAEVSKQLIHLRYKQLLQPEDFTTIKVFAAVIFIP